MYLCKKKSTKLQTDCEQMQITSKGYLKNNRLSQCSLIAELACKYCKRGQLLIANYLIFKAFKEVQGSVCALTSYLKSTLT